MTSFNLAITLGLAAAALWGVGDLVARFATRAVGPYRTLYMQQVIGLALLTAGLLATHGYVRAMHQPWQVWVWASVAGVLFNVGTLLLYIAFERGKLAVVSPLSASYAVVAAALSLLSGERLGAVALIGIVLVMAGIPFASSSKEVDAPGISLDSAQQPQKRGLNASGAGWAMAAALTYGFSFWLYGYRVTPYLGGFIPVWLSYFLSTILLIPFVKRRGDLPLRWNKTLLVIACGAVLAVCGTVCDLAGIATGHVALVTTLSSLYSTITVILAWLTLREPMHRLQWAGVALILVGIVLVHR